jgi:mycothiol synthase
MTKPERESAGMKVEYLKGDRVADFVKYCKKHKMEIDESFLYDADLENFEPNDENPTYIALNHEGNIVAVASIIMDEYHKHGKRARFRIFHSEVENLEFYKKLLEAILKHTDVIEKLFVYVPFENKKLAESLEGIDFSAERFSFLLVREDLEIPQYYFPEGYDIRPFRLGQDEETWCMVRNAGFAKLQGHETPITPEMVSKMMTKLDYIEGGSLILYHHEQPVGIIRGSNDEYEDEPIMNIGPIALTPEYQGKGLGRNLLRYLLDFAKEKTYNRTILCVNGENEKAKTLYVQEGYKQVEGVTCYIYRC